MIFRKIYLDIPFYFKSIFASNTLSTQLVFNRGGGNKLSKNIWNFAKFSMSMFIFSGFIAIYSVRNYGYYFKDSINWNPNWYPLDKRKNDFENGITEERKWRQNVLVRHGQYNMSGKCDEEKALTKVGREQAEETGKYLRSQYGDKVGIIYHSNLSRARETARIISKFFPDSKLVEDPNLAEGVPVYPSPPISGFDPKAKEINSDRKRIDNAFKTYFIPKRERFSDQVDIIVCHGNVIRYMFCKGLQYPTNGWLRLNHSNCGITRMSVSSDGIVVCNGFGDFGHLVPEIHTFN